MYHPKKILILHYQLNTTNETWRIILTIITIKF